MGPGCRHPLTLPHLAVPFRGTCDGRTGMTKARLLLLALLLAGTASCATKNYMKARPLDAGVKVVYKAPFDKVKRAAFDSLIERGFHYKDEDFGWGERHDKAFFINYCKGLG